MGRRSLMTKNFWLDNNELIIVFRDGTHHVIEEDIGYEVVFTGHFEECVYYCEQRLRDYYESVIG